MERFLLSFARCFHDFLSSLGGTAGYPHLQLRKSSLRCFPVFPEYGFLVHRLLGAASSLAVVGPASLLNGFLQLPEIKWVSRPCLLSRRRNLKTPLKEGVDGSGADSALNPWGRVMGLPQPFTENPLRARHLTRCYTHISITSEILLV